MNLNLAKNPLARRAWIGAAFATGVAGAAAAVGARPAPAELSRQRLRDLRTPNETLIDQDGRPLRFYDDVMKNRVVVMNVIYTTCNGICTPAMRNVIEARQLLGAQGQHLHFVTMTLTPLSDPPEALRDFKKLHDITDRWTFLTGKVESVEKVQRALGFLSARKDDNLLSHSGMARYCDERNTRWTHVNTMLSPSSVARMIRFEMV